MLNYILLITLILSNVISINAIAQDTIEIPPKVTITTVTTNAPNANPDKTKNNPNITVKKPNIPNSKVGIPSSSSRVKPQK